MKLFVTGVNGFIGVNLVEKILSDTDWHVSGFDIRDDHLSNFLENERFTFKKGDIFKDDDWMESAVAGCDVVVPLAGIAKPAFYIKNPIHTFELDFEQNLKTVRMCAWQGKRIIFPSTSEVYGITNGTLKEDESPLTTGTIKKSRWIYSCSKQMMDRVIFAYGQERGLRFSIFRPFNWTGPLLDSFKDAEERQARAITQMIYDVLYRNEISLVDGGRQRRSFTWIGDGVDAMIDIIRNDGGKADGEIFNIGNPLNNHSIREMSEILLETMQEFPRFRESAKKTSLKDKPQAAYYGENYDDIDNRVPCVEKIERLLGWQPKTSMRDMIRKTLEWYAEREIL